MGMGGKTAPPLLRTKLYTPPTWPEQVSRPRLVECLNEGLYRRLTLISAPAGFGKTTLLSECASRCGRPVAWVSLDKGDNDPVRFWTYFVAALQTIPSLNEAGVGDAVVVMLKSSQPPPIKALLTSLINEISDVPDPCILVLDDFHLITERRIHDGLAFALDNLPPQMHLILSTRADPPWSLARLRARSEMTELRADDLRFTPQEAATLLNNVMQLGLSPEDVAALEARTEGWIAGLQMAAVSMQGQRRTQRAHGVSGFVKAFTGSHRFVLDFLVEEVLDHQSSEVQEFLLKTSILERMSAPLCDTVTGRNDSHTILTQLEQANLFLVPLDDERRWYRYHRLFADLLRNRLEETRADLVPALHRQASVWHEEQGLVAEALNHALAAGDVERAAGLIEGNVLAMMDRGELATLVGWLDSLPNQVVRSRPWLCIAHAWLLVYAGQLDDVESHLQDAEKALVPKSAMSRLEVRHITGHITAIRAYVQGLRGDMSRTVELARMALEYLPQEDVMTRGFTAALLGSALRFSGHLGAAAEAFAEAIPASQAAGDCHVAVNVLCDLAVLQVVRGQLHDAAATCREALQLAGRYVGRGRQQLPAAGLAHARLSGVLREWNDLEAAVHHAQVGIELCEQWGQADTSIVGYVNLARARQAIGDADGALKAIQEAKRLASDLSSWYVAVMETYEARLRLAQGDGAAASRWAQGSELGVDDEVPFERGDAYRTLARVLIARGEEESRSRFVDESLRLLARLLAVAEVAGATGYVIDTLILQALALQGRGEREQALAVLERALFLAEPEGYVRIFIDEGPPMGVLLRQAATRGIAADYVSNLLATWDEETKDQGQTTKERDSSFVHRPSPVLVEPLSERELQVLRLLSTHLSSREMARELVISPHTVRSHIKSIYSKLNVHRRADAVERAEELGLP